jgi:hypothetical protein
VVPAALSSRNYGCRPGVEFWDGIELPGWEEQSVWGYDTGMGRFFAKLWVNGSTSDAPTISLPASGTICPWPGGIVLEIVERLNEDPLAVVHGLGLADPNPTVRSRDEIMQRIRELGDLGPPSRYVAGQIRALGWTHGLVESCPGSRRPWSRSKKPSPARVDAEHHLVTGRIYRGEDRDLDAGADEGLWWALGRFGPRESCGSRGRVVPDPLTTITATTSPVNDPARVWLDVPFPERPVNSPGDDR